VKQILYGIFDGDDVAAPRYINFLYYGGQGGRFSVARGPRHQKKALASSCDFMELFGEDEVFYEAYRFRYDPECHGHVAPLEETVTP